MNRFLHTPGAGRFILSLALLVLPALAGARESCNVQVGVARPSDARLIGPWQYPDYPEGVCVRRLPDDAWYGHLIGHPQVVKLTGDFNGDGCDQDVLWRVPGETGWTLNKGLGGTARIPAGSAAFAPADPSQFIGTYAIGDAGQEGVVWSYRDGAMRVVRRLDGSSQTIADAGVAAWFAAHPEAERYNPTVTRIVAIGDSLTAGLFSDPLANFREMLWQQLFDLTTCGREIALDWVGSVGDYSAADEPFLYGNDFYVDTQHEGHSGFKSCHVQQCIDAWMAGRRCEMDASLPQACGVEEGGPQSAPYTPDIALLMVGMNDLLRSDPNLPSRQMLNYLIDPGTLVAAQANVQATIDKLRDRNPQVVILLADVPGGGNPLGKSHFGALWPDYEHEREYLGHKNYRRFNYMLQQAAVQAATGGSPVVYVDQYARFVGDVGAHWDRVHFSYAGHQQVADAYALALDAYWKSDGQCSLPDVSPFADAGNNSFLIGDFDQDGCAQDIAYREFSGQGWSNHWQVLLAGSAAPYPLAPDAAPSHFSPGDMQQFVAIVDWDLDFRNDILWRSNLGTGWNINFGNPAKPSLFIADDGAGSVQQFDLDDPETTVFFCAWWDLRIVGWSAQVEDDIAEFISTNSNGLVRRTQWSGGWRDSPAWVSKGLADFAPCRVVGNL